MRINILQHALSLVFIATNPSATGIASSSIFTFFSGSIKSNIPVFSGGFYVVSYSVFAAGFEATLSLPSSNIPIIFGVFYVVDTTAVFLLFSKILSMYYPPQLC